MIPEFENAAYSLKEIGSYSEPVHSFYGWHIIKLLGRKGFGTFEEERSELTRKINNGDRADLKQQAYIEKLKKEYRFKFYPQNYQKIYSLVDSSIFQGKWNDSVSLASRDVIFTIGEKTVNLADFAKFLAEQQRIMQPYHLNIFINDQFKVFSESRILDYEQEMLPLKHPEFANIVEEYHDGILLFNLTDKMVWSKAVEDTTGLEKYFRQNKKKYMWKERLEAYVITSKNKNIIEQARILTLKNGGKKNFTKDFLKSQICPDDTTGNCLSVIYGKFEKGDNKEIDQTNWKEGVGETFTRDDLSGFVFIKKKIAPGVKEFDDVKGLITSDYQTYLELEWIKSLRKKYPVEGNFELLKKIN
jgi:peptidyl-prolyl cis-trans isomerase SurA